MAEQQLRKEILDIFKDAPDEKFSISDINQKLHLKGADTFRKLVQSLAQLEEKELITMNSKGDFRLNNPKKPVEGVFHANDRGFGFVTIDPDEPDAFIAPMNTDFALNGDTVQIDILKPAQPLQDKGPEGKIVAIVEHNTEKIVGEFTPYSDAQQDETGFFGMVQSHDKKLAKYTIYVSASGLKPQAGDMVQTEITAYPDNEHQESMLGIVTKTLGNKNDPGVDVLTIVYDHGVRVDFPDDALEQANAIPDTVQPEELEGRRDLTDQAVVTIDGDDSKDFDDAVNVWKLPNGNYHLGVHIADVSHYVTEDSPLDREAFERGTSTYLTDRVIPMLPFRLSNGICSLNPDVVRLTMTCEMEINPEGKVVKHDIFPSYIKSTARMTYNNVNQILAGDEALRTQYAKLVPMFEDMKDLHEILFNMRHRRGAIDFEEPEAKIIVNDQGWPVDIVLRNRGLSERAIESFMLAANETIAEHFYKKHVPFLYRVHETPDDEKIKKYFEFITNFGLVVKGSSKKVTPKMLQGVLAEVQGKPEEPVITMMTLRSMKQAHYADEQLGHFGLAAKYYTHFTSPIRRYPDLTVSRMIHSYFDHGTTEAEKDKWAEKLPGIATQSSTQERRSIDTERATDDLKKAEFMQDKVGQEFDAVISSVTSFGMFIELPNTVEGLIHISQLSDDYYDYVENQLALVGEHTHRIYRLGQPLKVKLERVDVDQREIDFSLVPGQKMPEDAELANSAQKQRRATQRERNNDRRPRRGNGKPNDHRSSNRNNNNHNGGNNNQHRSHRPSTGNRPHKQTGSTNRYQSKRNKPNKGNH